MRHLQICEKIPSDIFHSSHPLVLPPATTPNLLSPISGLDIPSDETEVTLSVLPRRIVPPTGFKNPTRVCGTKVLGAPNEISPNFGSVARLKYIPRYDEGNEYGNVAGTVD